MKRQWILGALVLAGVGCDVVLGIEAAVPCVVDGDCLVQTAECATAKCDAGQCKYQYDVEGKPLQKQDQNDCALLVCNGAGGVKSDPFDDADDGNPCTSEECQGGKVQPSVPITGLNVACYSGAKSTWGVGRCQEGTIQCNNGQPTGKCEGEVLPNATGEVCLNGVDDDCDGTADENFGGCACGDGILTPEIGEECDDGGTADGDDCSPTCKEQRVLQVDAGDEHTCALLSGGIVKCWGSNYSGQIGAGTGVSSLGMKPGQMGANLPPVNLGPGEKAIAISAGYSHTCALLVGGKVKCWGANEAGQLGLGDTKSRGFNDDEMGANLSTVDLGTDATAIAIDCGFQHTCALLSTGQMKCWGHGRMFGMGFQSLGDEPSDMGNSLPVINLGTGELAIAIATGSYHTCALLASGNVKCWGYNTGGKLGLGNTADRTDPAKMGDALPTVQLGPFEKPIGIVSKGEHTCALLAGNRVKCWGYNSRGQLGLGDNLNRGDEPAEMGNALPVVELGDVQSIKSITVGFYHSCVLTTDGTVKCWGEWLGAGNNEPSSNIGDEPNEMGNALPTVDIGSSATTIAAGRRHTCAILDNGSLNCWGGNAGGCLGLGLHDDETIGDNPGEVNPNLPAVKLFSDAW